MNFQFPLRPIHGGSKKKPIWAILCKDFLPILIQQQISWTFSHFFRIFFVLFFLHGSYARHRELWNSWNLISLISFAESGAHVGLIFILVESLEYEISPEIYSILKLFVHFKNRLIYFSHGVASHFRSLWKQGNVAVVSAGSINPPLIGFPGPTSAHRRALDLTNEPFIFSIWYFCTQ